MKLIHLAVVVVALTSLCSSCASTGGQTSSTPAPSATITAESSANTEQEIRKLQQEYDQAWVKQDVAAFERLIADDITQTDMKGRVLSKAQIIANAKSGDVKFESGKSDNIKVRVYGNTALVTSVWTEKSINKGEVLAGSTINTMVYVKKNGAWQVVSDQVTPIISQPAKR